MLQTRYCTLPLLTSYSTVFWPHTPGYFVLGLSNSSYWPLLLSYIFPSVKICPNSDPLVRGTHNYIMWLARMDHAQVRSLHRANHPTDGIALSHAMNPITIVSVVSLSLRIMSWYIIALVQHGARCMIITFYVPGPFPEWDLIDV